MKPNTPLQEQPGRLDLSLGGGIRCYFDVDGVTITVWGSAWSGREKVWVDDRLVSTAWSIRYTTEHVFEHDGRRYTVLFKILSILKGDVRIELYRDGQLVDFDQATFQTVKVDPQTGRIAWGVELRSLLVWVLVGAGFGAVVGFFGARLVGWLGGVLFTGGPG